MWVSDASLDWYRILFSHVKWYGDVLCLWTGSFGECWLNIITFAITKKDRVIVVFYDDEDMTLGDISTSGRGHGDRSGDGWLLFAGWT